MMGWGIVCLYVYLLLLITGIVTMANTIDHVSLRKRKKKSHWSYTLLGQGVFSEFFFPSLLLKYHLHIDIFSA